MNVTKDIDIKDLKEMLGNMIERCQTSLKPRVELDYNTAIRIYDVLEETQTREERHQTLESACTFMEMEDGTQTNEMELHNKPDENGNILRGDKAYEKITKMANKLQTEKGLIPECFGTFRYDRNLSICHECEYVKECCMKENGKSKTKEDNKKSCFGNYRDCYMCTHCIDCKKCREETIHREDVEEDDDFI